MIPRKRMFLLLFLPFLLLELLVLNRSLKNYFFSQTEISSSADSKIAWSSQIGKEAVLRANTNVQVSATIEKLLAVTIVFIVIFLGILWSKEGKKIFHD